MSYECENCGAGYTRPIANVARYGTRFCSRACQHDALAKERTRPLAARFWEKVDQRGEDECWPWLGGTFADGYGAISVDGGPKRAPRVSVELATGAPIPARLIVRHTCDDPACVNPSHLIVGTMRENTADMNRRGRANRPIKVTDAQVHEIRQSEAPLAAIAAKYGVSVGLVAAIRGKRGYRLGRAVTSSRRRERHHPA